MFTVGWAEMSRIIASIAGNGGRSHPLLESTAAGSPRTKQPSVRQDLVAVLLLGPVALVLILFLAIFIRSDGGPVFYSRKRLGKGGTTFDMWKLRTMVPNAERRLEEYLRNNHEARLEWERTQKLANDPRITKFGKYLRKFSMDELPQLWNVLMGHMSLVGPRPMFPEQRRLYPGTAYFELRPGLTGAWQVSARNGCSFAERAKYDTDYAQAISFKTDFLILLMTVVSVVRGTGL